MNRNVQTEALAHKLSLQPRPVSWSHYLSCLLTRFFIPPGCQGNKDDIKRMGLSLWIFQATAEAERTLWNHWEGESRGEEATPRRCQAAAQAETCAEVKKITYSHANYLYSYIPIITNWVLLSWLSVLKCDWKDFTSLKLPHNTFSGVNRCGFSKTKKNNYWWELLVHSQLRGTRRLLLKLIKK